MRFFTPFFFVIFFFFSSQKLVFANEVSDFIEVPIPGAQCGDGRPYSVKIRPGRTDRLFIEFMFGGACWNRSTCYGPNFRALPQGIEDQMLLTGRYWEPRAFSPQVAENTVLYFPYCTGDGFFGDHRARYGKKIMHHTGYSNSQKALTHLRDQGLLDFDQVEETTVVGSSAGAIAQLAMLPLVEETLPVGSRLTAIMDAPGLHFGDRIWHKLSDPLYLDIATRLQDTGVDVDRDDGNLAQFMPEFCRRRSAWNIAILQSSHDFAMSALFGSSNPFSHDKDVFAPNGLANVSLPSNCHVWIKQSTNHVYFIPPVDPATQRVEGMSALEFVQRAMEGRLNASYIEFENAR